MMILYILHLIEEIKIQAQSNTPQFPLDLLNIDSINKILSENKFQ